MKHYGQRDGLPSVQIYDLHGAHDQQLYLGTANGMYRFNGIRFERLPFKGQPASLSYITEHAGVIWCKDFSNRLFYILNDTVREFVSAKKYLSEGPLVNYALHDSNLYLASRKELIRCSLKTGKVDVLTRVTNDLNNILDIKIDANYLALAMNGKVEFYRFSSFEKIMQVEQPFVNSELEAKDGLFYISYRGTHDLSAKEVNPAQLRSEELGKLPAHIHSNFIRIWQGKVYWCTNNGAYVYNRTTKTFELSFLPNKRISDLMTDERGNHWISTLDHSIYLLPFEQNLRFILPLPNEERITALSKGQNGQILAGTNLGSVHTYHSDGKLLSVFPRESHDQIQFLDLDVENGILYFTHGVKDIKGRGFHQQFLGRSLARDRLGNYVYAAGEMVAMSGNQLLTFPIAQKKKQHLNRGKIELVLRPQRARKVLYDSFRGLYLVAYTDKLMAYSVLGDEFEISKSNGKSLIVNEMMQAPDNSIWLGTMSEGIWKFNNPGEKAKKLTYPGLSSNFIKKMVTNREGIVWVATDRGLDYFRPNLNTFEPYRELLGLSSVYIYDLLENNDNLFLATDQGVLKLPINPNIERRSPKLHIRRTTVNGMPWQLENSTLPVAFKNLRIDFLPVHYQSEGMVFAQYRMGSEDSSWSTLPAGVQTLNLFGLPSGVHVLELRLLANNAHSETYSWSFKVAAPIWQRWWFITAMAVSLIGTTVMLSRNYNRRKTKNRLLEEALAASKLTAMKAQMNPHFLYNVLNSIQGLIYANKKEEAADYLSKFSDLMRLTLNFSDKQWHEISEEISALDLYLQLEAGRFSADFSFEVRIDEATRRENPLVPSMLIQPYVENAIKHGLLHKVGPKRLTVDFSMHSDINRIIITVEDNGIGRKQSAILADKRSKSHRSFATQSLQSRLQILNQLLREPVEVEIIDKKNDHQQATGTLVIIRLPFKYE